MRTVKIQGGLGNQLFGLAFARSVALLGGKPVALDLAGYRTDRYGRGFDLAKLASTLFAASLSRRPWLSSRLVTAVARRLPLPGYVSETRPPHDGGDLARLIEKGLYFNWYWQDERYVADPVGFVAATRSFVLARAPRSPLRDVVIHFRSYKEEIRSSARGTPGPDYLRRALERIEATQGRPADIALVSDDPALAREWVGDIGRHVTFINGSGPFADMALLMSARALILTNSSFSWWGGFCGEAALITYPERDRLFHYPAPAARFVIV